MRLFLLILCIPFSSVAQVDWKNYDIDSLNYYITIEVNKLRQKVKKKPLEYQPLLNPAAQDHATYMSQRKVLTHTQKLKPKKTPKNRIDFYGEQFETIGENVQFVTLNSVPKELQKKGEPKSLDSYELMAKTLVLNWKNSPPHYKNMIHPEFSGTTTIISVSEDGVIYACQLFGNEPFAHQKKNDALNYKYKLDKNNWKSTTKQSLNGTIQVLDDGSIYYSSSDKKSLKKLVRNPWRGGIAADIVLKSQYLCDKKNAFNGKRGVRGIPMNPVFRKNFRAGKNVFRRHGVRIYLGKVPEWINEEFEVNLTIVNKKRTFETHTFEQIPLEITLDLDIKPIVKIQPEIITETKKDTLLVTVSYEKSGIAFNPDSLKKQLSIYADKLNNQSKVTIQGFASIEGTQENNEKLYQKRAENIATVLRDFQIDSTKIKVEVAENFKAFRKDIKGTRFEFLNELNDEDLRTAVNEKWSDSLEPILKHHRYANLKLYLQWNDTVVDTDRLKQLFDRAISVSDNDKAAAIFNFIIDKVHHKQLDKTILEQFQLPESKLFSYQQFQKLLIDVPNEPWLDNNFIYSVYNLVELNPKQKQVKTYYYWLLYNQSLAGNGYSYNELFDGLLKQKNIDVELSTRMLISLGSRYDVALFFFGVEDKNEYYHRKLISFYKRAKLTDDEEILMAQYFYFFGYNDEAKSLLRKGISEKSSLKDIVTYLKIMRDSKMGLTEKQYFNLLKTVSEWKEEEFCTIFNSPNINFQIMDNDEIKALYCQKCR